MAADYMRIGDAERDQAVGMLQEHHATGRLGAEEFDDRMSRALVARTMSEIHELFLDLPDPKPGSAHPAGMPSPVPPPSYAYGSDPVPYGEQPGHEVAQPAEPTPWYAQWWMIIIAVVLASALDLGILIPLAAIWIWVIYPSLVKNRRARPVQPAAPPRPLTYMEREHVMDEVRAGRKINAIKRYRELTGADLVTARHTVELWSRQIGR